MKVASLTNEWHHTLDLTNHRVSWMQRSPLHQIVSSPACDFTKQRDCKLRFIHSDFCQLCSAKLFVKGYLPAVGMNIVLKKACIRCEQPY